MDIEDHLVARLLTTEVVTDIIGDRVYPLEVAQGDTRPALVYVLGSDEPINTTGGSCLYESVVMFDCLAKTYTEARALQRAVTKSLDGFSAVGDGSEIILTRYEGIVGNEKEKDSEDYHIIIRFNILNK